MWYKIYTWLSYDESDDESESDDLVIWIFGFLAPLALVIYGLRCIINRAGFFRTGDKYSYWYGDQYDVPFFGIDAVILGIFCSSFASFLHFYFFWGFNQNKKLKNNYKYGISISILALLPSFGWVVWCLLRSMN